MKIVVYEKFTSGYLHQIAREIILFLENNLHEKCITESQDRRILAARTICNLYSYYNFAFALVLRLCIRVTEKMHSFSAHQTRKIFFHVCYYMDYIQQS